MPPTTSLTPAAAPQAASDGGRPQRCIRVSRPGSEHCQAVQPDRISDEIRDETALVWVDLRDPTPEDLEMLRHEFGFHRLALEDVARQRQRPKVDEYPGYFFVVIYALVPGQLDSEIRTVELDMFVGPNYVVSAHQGEIPGIQEALERWQRTEPELRHQVGFLVHTLLDSIIDGYFPVVDRLDDRLDTIEMSLYQPTGPGADIGELLDVKRDLFTLRRSIYPMREVFNTFLRRDHTIFSEQTYPYFQDVYDHILRLLDVIDIQRDMATGTLDAHLTVISNRLNETMKRLTVVAICVAIMGAVFGAWGMNFDEVPLHQFGVRGFLGLAAGTLVLVGIALAVMKWRRLW